MARSLNVSRDTLATVRQQRLVKGTDWTSERNAVCFTSVGLKKMLGVLGLAETLLAQFDAPTATGGPSGATPEADSIDGKKIAAPATLASQVTAAARAEAARPTVDMRVVSLSRNPTILHASADSGKTTVLVRVRTNENFVPGMPIRVRAPAPGQQLHFFEGHCPRWKGRY